MCTFYDVSGLISPYLYMNPNKRRASVCELTITLVSVTKEHNFLFWCCYWLIVYSFLVYVSLMKVFPLFFCNEMDSWESGFKIWAAKYDGFNKWGYP